MTDAMEPGSRRRGPEKRYPHRVTVYVDDGRKKALGTLRTDRFQADPTGSIPQESEVVRDVVDAGLKALGYDPETGERIARASEGDG